MGYRMIPYNLAMRQHSERAIFGIKFDDNE